MKQLIILARNFTKYNYSFLLNLYPGFVKKQCYRQLKSHRTNPRTEKNELYEYA